ncbi:putative colanic acid biosynthesis acetyltransferase [Polaribacter sp. R2A056_3_33]|uniref:putative colanic acid biosynthesis acetyltransferase n=1 Tax=Polaribacter sp. R2A056_3_33 TaxID=2745563 RepID=UPI001C4E89E0|nr:putative colanic acid biosynthesis acetyltransferase [Polaribacter sp. R2A056_3_33]QXP69082.1 putative colanic acid biosynthesis acetyltransferase [Polaribacter sp. R2A056_3_33]
MKYEKYQNNISIKNKVLRLIWNLVWWLFFRPFSLPFFNRWRIFLLRLFGAKIGKGCKVHASVKFWAPWNLEMGDLVAFGFDALCYNPGKIIIGSKVSISQRAHLCSASHDITDEKNPLITAPIIIEDRAWVATDTFISMGVTIKKGGVVGAKAAVFKDVESWTVVGGNPAKFLKKREIIK